MRFPRLISKLYFEPLLLSATARMSLESAFQNYLAGSLPDPEALSQKPAMSERTADIYEQFGNVVVIRIDGVIDKHISQLDMLCYGGVDLDDVESALACAEADSAVGTIVLAINSPGGSVTGVPECAASIARIKAGGKDVIAFTDSQCCSAAYWIASAANEVIVSESAVVGSIGVYVALLDQSKAMEMQGLKVELVKAGAFKAAGAPFKELSSDERAMFQARVDDIYSQFCTAVCSGRGEIATESMQGQVFSAKDAIANGLADQVINSLDELVSSLM